MTFHSILFERGQPGADQETTGAPDFFTDLNLDQIVDAVTAGKREYNLKPFFYTPLIDVDTICYRQEVMQDVDNGILLDAIQSFAQNMIILRRYLAAAAKLDFPYHQAGWFLEAALEYCEGVTGLVQSLAQTELKSRGLVAFRAYLTGYAGSERFTRFLTETTQLKAALSTVKYCVLIKGDLVKVRRYESEMDYSLDVEATFEKFKQGAVKDFLSKLYEASGMNHIEAQIQDLVARLYPDVFAELVRFYNQNRDFPDQTISIFDREIQFYVTYQEHIATLKQAGLKFCYPQVTPASKAVYSYEGFDLALANKLIREQSPLVCNDFTLQDPERILIVSGPNQGGKTTFARTFGQLHYLASLGCTVPGREAQLFLFDQLFTHFEKEEDIRSLRGKLQDDLVRINAILEQATPNSLMIMNEIFNSTTLKDAIFLSKKIIEQIIDLDLLCVCVTFIDELATLSEKTVSMVSTVDPEDPARRTYKIIRRPADGVAYALSIAEKHRLTYTSIKERIRP